MNRVRMMVVMGAALVLAVVVTFGAYRLVRERLKPPENMVTVVVVNQEVKIGARLTAMDVRTTEWPKSVVLEGLFHDPMEVVGRGVMIPLKANEPVLESKLAPKEAGAGIQITIPEGMRAVSVRVNDVIGVAGFVVPGSRVDVILVGSLNGPSDSATTILENVQVLAAGTDVNRDAEGPKPAPVVTLLLTPEDSEKLALVTADGRIQLALRHPLDHVVTNPRVVSRTDVLKGSAARPGAAAPVQVAYQQPASQSPSVLAAPAAPVKLARPAEPPKVAAPAPPPPSPVEVAKKPDPIVCQPTKVQLISAPDRVQVIQFETKPTGDPKQPCA